eukprot:SAG25_NODE_248_length_11053_cov_5.754359_2_plen_80_part_00
MLMDPSRTDAKVLSFDPEDFEDNTWRRKQLRDLVDGYMGGRTQVLSMWRVIDPSTRTEYGFPMTHEGLRRSRWERVVHK